MSREVVSHSLDAQVPSVASLERSFRCLGIKSCDTYLKTGRPAAHGAQAQGAVHLAFLQAEGRPGEAANAVAVLVLLGEAVTFLKPCFMVL